MKIYCIFMIFACVLPKSSAYHISDSEAGRNTASTLVKEGLPAEIFCMVEGTGYYFWRKGESFHKSTLVASFTGDNANKDNDPYVVTVNGTLLIRNVTLEDEGKYFCRVTSVENECHGEVKVFVQASLLNFDLAIDRCDGESSCLLYLYPSQLTSLTCTALNAPPLMSLKWFTGSKEITEGIQQNEILPQNGNSREITSTVTAVYGHPASLTCQAVDPKRGNDDIRFAHAQVEMKVHAHETWMIVSVTSAGCFNVFGIFLLITAMANRKQKKKYKMLKTERHQSLQEEAKTNEEAINLKHKELTEVMVSAGFKDSELSELKGKLSQTEEELKKSRKENIDSLKNIASNEAKITLIEEIAKAKDQQIKDKDEELTKLKGDVQSKAKLIAELEGDVQSKAKLIAELESKLKQKEAEVKERYNQIMEVKEKVQAKANEITELKETVKQKDKEINDQRENVLYCQTDLHRKEIDIQRKSDDISKLQSNLKEKQNEIENLQKELAKLKGVVPSKPKRIADLETTLKQRDEEIKEASNKIFELQGNLNAKENELGKLSKGLAKLKGALLEKERELNLAKHPKGAKQGSQKKPGK